MRATRSEQTLRRVIAWLRLAGWELTPSLEQAVLQALAEAVASGDADLFGTSLRLLQRDGVLSVDTRMAAVQDHSVPTPPLRRSSIGYGSY